MSATDESLQTILDNILKEYEPDGMRLTDSSLNEDVRLLIKAKLANVLLERLKLKIEDKLDASKEIEIEFEAAVYRTWKKPLNLLALLLNVCLEVANELTLEQGAKPSVKQSCVQEALARQHANACLVFNEILHLLKSGFPSGAHLHWRALHEIACASYFISKHGEKIAKRFLDYEVVENHFQVEAMLKHQQKMECASLSKRDFKELNKKFAKMRETYGSDFVRKSNYPYGWIPRQVLKTRSLKEVEKKAVELEVLRSYYDLASYNVFGGPRRLIFKSGIMKSDSESMVLPVGPSNYGLADPGKSAAISLGQVTACLLMVEPTAKRLIVVEALRNLVDEVCDAFCEIQADFGKFSKI
jgi:hypothetical protein